uniref:O-methyltransferase domain-containing protein n=1 Tax=Phasianus colchicus TaxID=9054 RepID=A0A669PJU4_PHACC
MCFSGEGGLWPSTSPFQVAILRLGFSYKAYYTKSIPRFILPRCSHPLSASNFHCEQRTVFLRVLILYFHSSRKILLIGKLKGYSILAIAEELPDDGKIFACAEVPYLGVNSQEAFDYSSDGEKISMRVGPIADTLEALHAEDEHFDIVFIDADQRNAVNYYSFVMDNHLLRMDGVICVENTLMKGQVYLENISEENVLAVRKLNTVINSDPRVEQVGAMQLVRLPVVLYLWILQSTHQNLSFVGVIIQGT